MDEPARIINMSAKLTKSQMKFNRRIRNERGNHCEVCGATADQGQIEAHHVLDRRAFPDYAKVPENILVLCQSCHSQVTDSMDDLTGEDLLFYGALPYKIRMRLADFMVKNEPRFTTFIQT